MLKIRAEEVERRWHRIRYSSDGAAALNALLAAGCNLSSVSPTQRNSITGLIAVIPSLPRRKAGSAAQPRFKAVPAIVRQLRQLADAQENGDLLVEAMDRKGSGGTIYLTGAAEIAPKRLREVAAVLEDLLVMKRWVVTRINPQQAAIATLRWHIRHRTREHTANLADIEGPSGIVWAASGRPARTHGFDLDETLRKLLRAAWRAAERTDGPPSGEAIRKAEVRERAARVTGRSKLRRDDARRKI